MSNIQIPKKYQSTLQPKKIFYFSKFSRVSEDGTKISFAGSFFFTTQPSLDMRPVIFYSEGGGGLEDSGCVAIKFTFSFLKAP